MSVTEYARGYARSEQRRASYHAHWAREYSGPDVELSLFTNAEIARWHQEEAERHYRAARCHMGMQPWRVRDAAGDMPEDPLE